MKTMEAQEAEEAKPKGRRGRPMGRRGQPESSNSLFLTPFLPAICGPPCFELRSLIVCFQYACGLGDPRNERTPHTPLRTLRDYIPRGPSLKKDGSTMPMC